MEYVCDGKRSQGRRKNLCVKLWRNYKESFSFLSRVKLKFEFKCSTCNEGGFCLDCYKKISKHSFAFEGEEVRDRAPTFNEELGLAMEPLPEGYTTKNLWLLF